jgi:hypothetical protein
MANLFLIMLICLPLVDLQRHRILCAIVGDENSQLCTKSNAIVSTTTPKLPTPTSTSTSIFASTFVMTTSASYVHDFEYICVPFIVFLVYIFHVFYLRFGLALSWKDSLTHSVVRLVVIYRAIFGTTEANTEVICCPTIYNLCMDTNVVGQSDNIVMPTGMAPVE